MSAANEKYVSLQVLACLAWADGTVTETEEDKLVEFIAYAVGMTWVEVRKVLGETKTIDDEMETGIKKLSRSALSGLLGYGYEMANTERPIADSETALLRRVAALNLGDEAWDDVSTWLQAQHQANDLHKKLFGYG